MHKYWGRKSQDLVAHYISANSKPGDVVLDPFMGSGGVLIESKRLGRSSIGVDLNPISRLIVENTLSEFDAEVFRNHMDSILSAVPADVWEFSSATCPECGQRGHLKNAIWEGDELTRVKGLCAVHGMFRRDANESDKATFESARARLAQDVSAGVIWYPTDRLLDFVRRSGKETLDQLYSARNLLQVAHVFKHVNAIQDPRLRSLYLMVFTSMLPNVSAMIPADKESVTGKSGWQISKFWVPTLRTEKSVRDSFISRVKTITSGLKSTEAMFTKSPAVVLIQSSEALPSVEDNSVDLVFADPPYGDSIAYLGLSMFWNSWLGDSVDYSEEIIYDPYRRKTFDEYQDGLERVFKEMSRVLKDGKPMVITFNNRKVKFWRILLDAISRAGFEIDKVEWQEQAVSSGTQGINRKNTLRGDFAYTFVNRKGRQPKVPSGISSGSRIVIDVASELIDRHHYLSSADLYCAVIPEIVRSRGYTDELGKDLDVETVMSGRFTYGPVNLDGRILYGWTDARR
jgi:16S rRNA G966 N2-methylase RsmD